MLHIKIVCVGKLKEIFWCLAVEEYLKRLRPYADINIIEIADCNPDKAGGAEGAVNIESEKIASYISGSQSSYVVLLDVEGKLLSSEEIAQTIEEVSLEGTNDIIFIIGGSCGVNDDVKKLCNLKMSFGKITLPHNLARVVLVEQIYRAFKIIRNEPYHK